MREASDAQTLTVKQGSRLPTGEKVRTLPSQHTHTSNYVFFKTTRCIRDLFLLYLFMPLGHLVRSLCHSFLVLFWLTKTYVYV